jgi:beta-mannosidase
MPAPVKSITGYRREALTTGWELCSTPPDTHKSPRDLSQAPLQWLPAHAPSTVAASLRAANLWSLDAPPRRFDAEDWWYRLRFAAPPCAAHEEIVLGFDGLATVADVWLNDEPLLSSDNMFIAHERIVHTLHPGANELTIRFRALDRLLEAKRPRPKWRAPMVENQQLRWFRTTLLGRTPGWSPPAAAVGPWRGVWLETRAAIHLPSLVLRNGVDGSMGWVEVAAVLEPMAGRALTDVALVVTRGTGQRHSIALKRAQSADSYCGRLEIPNIALWWPHTHGEPALYEARLELTVARLDTQPVETERPDLGRIGTQRGHALPDETSDTQPVETPLEARAAVDLGQIGFRTITLDTKDGDFELRINGVPIFCRGACWTPLDPVSLDTSSGADADSVRRALEQVRAAGLNMLRVGGTMIYESDTFLDLCDANGILLWQDFMFANMEYPETDAGFSASVAAEARQQLGRLAAHPCLTLLCGNSEGEQQAAMWGAPRETWSSRLFHEQLAQLARELCPDVPYWPSSAHGGSFPHQGNVGTTSYYGVGAYLRPLEDARRAEVRFASECLAFANIPEERTLSRMPGGPAIRCHHPAWKARTPRDLGAGWDFDDVRDHYLALLFKVDPLELRYADHERYLELSRVVTGEVMARVFAEWRRKRSTCRGALVWFWRDLWCGAGWGVVDALGTPKAAYHYLRRAWQPIAVSISDEGGNGLYVHAVNEHAAPLVATLELKLYRAGEIGVGSATRTLTLAGRETAEIAAADLFEGFLDLSYAYRFGPPPHELVVATLTASNGAVLAQAFHSVGGLTASRELDVGLSATAIARGDSAFNLKIATRRYAQSVWIECDGFVPDDTYFHLAPGSERAVVLTRNPREPERPLRGRVHALNAHTPAKIEIRA